LWDHTRELRELRERQHQPIVLAIEEEKHKHRRPPPSHPVTFFARGKDKPHIHKDDKFEIVKKNKRRLPPSSLIAFFAGMH